MVEGKLEELLDGEVWVLWDVEIADLAILNSPLPLRQDVLHEVDID